MAPEAPMESVSILGPFSELRIGLLALGDVFFHAIHFDFNPA